MLAASSASLASANPRTRFSTDFPYRYVEVFDLELQPDRQAPIHDNIYDLVWIALDDEVLQIEQREGGTKELQLFAGETRFFPGDKVKSLVNARKSVQFSLRHHLFIAQTFEAVVNVDGDEPIIIKSDARVCREILARPRAERQSSLVVAFVVELAECVT